MLYGLFVYFIPAIIVFIDFLVFLFRGRRWAGRIFSMILDVFVIVIMPLIYLTIFEFGKENTCCGDSAIFSPDHRLSVYIIILLSVLAYFYCGIRKSITTPVLELVLNTLLLTAIVLNIFVAIQIEETFLWSFGNLPIILLIILTLKKNQELLVDYLKTEEIYPANKFEKFAWNILTLKPFAKIPILFALCIPLLILLALFLLLFGQKPDSMIRAFTDTYNHGFSQWDYMCDNVFCGGHFLCSVAAKGHKKVVKPQRFGTRDNRIILCNRQLLVSNAFEELLQQKMPWLHKPIRKHYNIVGRFIHRYYSIFNNKFVADAIYLLMKPAEWLFLLILYTFDHKPENRIAQQYMSIDDRRKIVLQTIV